MNGSVGSTKTGVLGTSGRGRTGGLDTMTSKDSSNFLRLRPTSVKDPAMREASTTGLRRVPLVGELAAALSIGKESSATSNAIELLRLPSLVARVCCSFCSFFSCSSFSFSSCSISEGGRSPLARALASSQRQPFLWSEHFLQRVYGAAEALVKHWCLSLIHRSH